MQRSRLFPLFRNAVCGVGTCRNTAASTPLVCTSTRFFRSSSTQHQNAADTLIKSSAAKCRTETLPPLPRCRLAEPCSLNDGLFPSLLHSLIKEEQVEGEERLRDAFRDILDIVSSAGVANLIEDDNTRRLRISGALKTITRDSFRRQEARRLSSYLLFHTEQPPGTVLVPREVGYAYVELQTHGFDADAWWAQYYRKYVPQTPNVDTVVRAPETDNTAIHPALVKVMGAHGVPGICWALQSEQQQQQQHRHSSSPGHLRLRFASPLLPPRPLGSTCPPDASTPISVAAQHPCWIPMGLIAHLPFFPLPLPDQHVRFEADEQKSGFQHHSSDPFLNDATDSSLDAAEPDDAAAGTISALSSSGFSGGTLSESSQPFVPPLERSNTGTWMHGFYDELFGNRGFAPVAAPVPSLPFSCDDSLAAQQAMFFRQSSVLEAPWRMVPLITPIDDDDEQQQQHASAAAPGGESPAMISRRVVPLRGRPLARRPVSASSLWPSPPLGLHLTPNYQKYLSTFWSRKADVTNNLPQPHFFPLSAFSFLSKQREQWDARFMQRQQERKRLLSVQRLMKVAEANRVNDVPFAAPDATRGLCRDSMQRGVDVSPFAKLFPSTGQVGVAYFGRRFVPVAATSMACLFDSSVCVTHAIPLDPAGNVAWRLLLATRHRQHHRQVLGEENAQALGHSGGVLEASSDKHLVSAKGSGGHGATPGAAKQGHVREAITQHSTSSSPSTLRSPWLKKLHHLQAQENMYSRKPRQDSFSLRLVHARAAQRSNQFTFRSPYWLPVHDLYEHWGVHVASQAIPLVVGSETYVNAEQTTDASRFTAATCVPHLQQEILFTDRFVRAPWALSQRLLRLLVGEIRPRRHRGREVGAWTYETLKQRAAAAQRVSNLWIAEEVVRMMRWTLAPTSLPTAADSARPTQGLATRMIVQVAVPVSHFPSEVLRARLLKTTEEQAAAAGTPAPAAASTAAAAIQAETTVARDFLFPAPISSVSPGFTDTSAAQTVQRLGSEAAVTLIHSSCLVEQEQLSFVAAYSPRVLLTCVAGMTEREFQDLRQEETGSVTSENIDEDDNDDEGNLTDQFDEGREEEEDEGDGDDVSRLSGDNCGNSSSRLHRPLSKWARRKLAHVISAQQKPFHQFWSGAKLTSTSRLDLARLALEKGYREENAPEWVTLDFLREESRVRPRSHAQPPSATAVESSLTAIDVVVYVRSASERSQNNDGDFQNESDALVSHYGVVEEENDFANGKGLATVKLTLINREELEWPESLRNADRRKWLMKYL